MFTIGDLRDKPRADALLKLLCELPGGRFGVGAMAEQVTTEHCAPPSGLLRSLFISHLRNLKTVFGNKHIFAAARRFPRRIRYHCPEYGALTFGAGRMTSPTREERALELEKQVGMLLFLNWNIWEREQILELLIKRARHVMNGHDERAG